MRRLIACATLLCAMVATGPALAEEAPPMEPKAGAPEVGLDQLLRLPNSYDADVDRRSGATETEWRRRFREARQELADAEKRLAEIERELKETSQTSAGWSVAAPGAADPQASPLSLRLREEVKVQRARIEAANRRIRELEVEADLAAVPPEWRE